MSALWTSFIFGSSSHNDNNGLVAVGSSPDGVNWTINSDLVPASALAPSLAGFDNGVNTQLYCAYVAGNNTPGGTGTGTGAVLVSSTADGVNWAGNTFRESDGGPTIGYTNIGQQSPSAPSLAVFNNQLYCAFIGTDASQPVLVCSTADGVDWTGYTNIGQQSPSAPSLAVFNNQLYCAFVADNGTGTVLVASSPDGVNWTGDTNIGQLSATAPSLAVFNGQLYCAFVADDGTGTVLVASSPDGVDWTGSTNIGQLSATAPSLTPFNNQLYCAFVADNGTGTVLVCSTADGVDWTGNTNATIGNPFGGTSATAPSLAVF
jgi:hypothetical protein